MDCPHEVKCCHYCPCHFKICNRCRTHSLLHFEEVPVELREKCWRCPKCFAFMPFKKEHLNDFRINKI